MLRCVSRGPSLAFDIAGSDRQYDFGNKSYFRLFGLFGYGVTNFSAENLGNSVGAFETNVNNFRLGRPARDGKAPPRGQVVHAAQYPPRYIGLDNRAPQQPKTGRAECNQLHRSQGATEAVLDCL
jgi:hypothetical protein